MMAETAGLLGFGGFKRCPPLSDVVDVAPEVVDVINEVATVICQVSDVMRQVTDVIGEARLDRSGR